MAGEMDEAAGLAAEQEDTQADEQALADLAAGFDDTPAPAPTTTPEPEQEPEKPAAEAPAPAADAPAAPEYVQLTKQQYDDLLAGRKQLDTVFGTIGGFKQTLERLQQQTAPGQPVEITAEDLADLSEEYPELAGPALKAFQKVVGKLRGTGGSADPAAIEKAVSDRTDAIRTELMDSRLDEIVDGDWRAETKTAPFQAWWQAQDAETKALGASDSPRDAARVLKAWMKAKTAPPPPAPKPPAPPSVSSRQRQLAAAVNPRGVGGAPAGKSPEDELNEGFSS